VRVIGLSHSSGDAFGGEFARRPGSRIRDGVGIAMFKILHMRCQIFSALDLAATPVLTIRFFSTQCTTNPVIAGQVEVRSQVMAAAAATRSDYRSVMKFLGLS